MDDLVLHVLDYLRPALLILNVLVAIFVVYYRSRAEGDRDESEAARQGPVLFVIAHPDDEAMFFVPSILGLLKSNREVHLLCLSNGDFEGPSTGKVRIKELYASANVLGISKANIKIVEDEKLRDGPHNRWSADLIAQFVQAYANEKKFEAVITFDEGGVSAHPNHIAVYHGVAQFLAAAQSSPSSTSASPSTSLPSTSSTLSHRGTSASPTATATPSEQPELRGFKLETTNVLRKYSGPLDLVWSSLTSDGPLFITPSWLPFWPVHRAMQAHHSQYVWFRRLSVPFSRYSYINTLRPIVLPPASSSSSSSKTPAS